MGKGRWRHVTPEVRRDVMRLVGQGLSRREIMLRLELPSGTLQAVLAPLGGVIRRDVLEPTGKRLSLEERVEIYTGFEKG